MAVHFKFLLVLLLALFTFSVSGQLIASINCGSSEDIDDSNSITWTADETFVSNGDARVVQSPNSIPRVMDTLRVFTTRKKNCYSIPVTQDQKVLIRASFNYGNYDRLSNPPTFDLHFDGNYWATVETQLSGISYYEVIYVAKGDSVSVCVAQTRPDQFPFISAVEVRGVDSEVYSQLGENRALYLLRRFAYGATQSVRYPDDPYDRIWISPSDVTDTVTTEATSINSTSPNNPPLEVFQNAMTSNTSSLTLARVTPTDGPYYISMYFSEVSNLDSNRTRSFRFYETSTSGTRLLSSLAYSPTYERADEYYLYNYTVGSITDISLVATNDSDLPPIINALEMFSISGVLTDGTDSNDVEALTLLQSTFDVLAGWSGDPCLPANYSWDWLNCSYDATPRVTSLFLDSFELSGIFPDISSMDALEIIDLHNNTLTGTIPSFLGTMPNLQQLNLADNQFSGPIPTSLSNNNKLKLNVTGNPNVCTSGNSCSSSPGSTTVGRKTKSSILPVVLGITIPLFVLIWVAVGIFIVCRQKTKRANANIPNVTGDGANENHNGVQKNDEEQVNETAKHGVRHTIKSLIASMVAIVINISAYVCVCVFG